MAHLSQRGLDDYPPYLVQIAKDRLALILPLLDLPPHLRTRAAFIDYLHHHALPSAKAITLSTLYRWIKAYEAAGRDIQALIPRSEERDGKHTSRLFPEVEHLLQVVLQQNYLVRE